MTTPTQGLIRIVDLLNDGDLCPHKLDKVIDAAIDHGQLASGLFDRLAEMTCASQSYQTGMTIHLQALKQADDDSKKEAVIEGAMVMGLLFGMMLVFEVCELEEVTLASLVN